MALRCERCKTADLTLETFGVYQCRNCGRVDADGHLVGEAATRGDATQPTILETGRASFVAPPPTSAAPIAATLGDPAPTATREMPSMFLASLAVIGLLDVASSLAQHSATSLILGAAFNLALLTGKRWARTLSLAGAVLTIGLCAMGFVLLHASPMARIAFGTLIIANAWWMYVLLRPDTVAYFSR